jgi:hypothetical protein
VSVAATPGKTKHFQTLNIDDKIGLCDCPGLVFPTFMESKAALVCNGILPIDQLTDHVPAVTLLVYRIPRQILLAVYGLSIPKWKAMTAEVFLQAHGLARGYLKGHGRPDEARSARIVLKDMVKGSLLYSQPPPGLSQAERLKFSLASQAHYLDFMELTDRVILVGPVGSSLVSEKKSSSESKQQQQQQTIQQQTAGDAKQQIVFESKEAVAAASSATATATATATAAAKAPVQPEEPLYDDFDVSEFITPIMDKVVAPKHVVQDVPGKRRLHRNKRRTGKVRRQVAAGQQSAHVRTLPTK